MSDEIAGARALLSLGTALAPSDAGGWFALGLCCRDVGARADAEIAFARAAALRPDWAEAHFERAQMLLLGGDYGRGFAEYAWRWKRAATPARTFSRPPWRGEEARGKTILLYAEQGAGDAIQFVRYAPLAAGLGARVALACHDSLKRLFATVEGVAEVMPLFREGGPFECHAPLMGLPAIYGTTVATIPARVPYLEVPAGTARLEFAADDGAVKIGLAWAGNPAHANDRARSCPADALAPLAAIPGVRLFGLQVGVGAAETLARVFPGARDLGQGFGDFADTAAAIAALDLVIAVDTAVAHLAGALARQVWTLLPFAPDWRWLEARDDSPWYPTMRLFRQRVPGDWREVGERVAAALKAALEGK